MILKLLIWIVLLPALQPSGMEIEITLRHVDHPDAPVSGVEVTFVDEAGVLSGRCVSDEEGRCFIALSGTTEVAFIRRYLDLGASGRRALTWANGEDVAIELRLDGLGRLHVPGHEPHPTPLLPGETLPALAPPATVTVAADDPVVVVIPEDEPAPSDIDLDPLVVFVPEEIGTGDKSDEDVVIEQPQLLEVERETQRKVVERNWWLVATLIGLFIAGQELRVEAAIYQAEWRPAGVEWWPATHVRKVVALPYSEALINDILARPEVTVQLRSGAVVHYRLEEASRLGVFQIELMRSVEPSLALIFYEKESDERWVLVGPAVQGGLDGPIESMERVIDLNPATTCQLVEGAMECRDSAAGGP